MRLRSALLLMYALYVAFILMTQIPILAKDSVETRTIEDQIYNFTFEQDGQTVDGNFIVERADTKLPGTIGVVYQASDNILLVDAVNIKSLEVNCRSIYMENGQKIFGINL